MEEEVIIKTEEGQRPVTEVISVKQWVINLVIMCIPVVNIVFLILWAFVQGNINQTKRNWAKAAIILMVAEVVLAIVLLTAFGLFTLKY